ncbi:16S rRNA (cytidine(1402)-2'-O)-methyltransferase [Nitrincola alkalilacustris]|uniref:16S rRNA (cytidine(1402)-2'-O)-methyltransferase n=1 Tax=Nitrincola alkalilacustris TaxID=1571224 RepID=UPI00124EB868|nr:16S rRNA (cytidine(1402)-2'-O)-methyltransferase [Nitrincola alkalilacustris]
MSDPVLYVIATPIGNLDDLSPRALSILSSVDYIAAEDTRHTGRMLAHFNIKVPMISVHDHNEDARSLQIVQYLTEGKSLALVSDAGTPLISDPGYVLVKRVRDAGFKVSPVPGCCAFVAALSVSGLPSDRFLFCGFLPSKPGMRRKQLEQHLAETATLIFYESTHRIVDSLAMMREVYGDDRQAVVARELTKTFETIQGGTLAQLCDWVNADTNQQRGEFVVLLHGATRSDSLPQVLDAEAERIARLLAEELPPKQAAGLAASITGLKKKQIYDWLVSQSALR